MKTVRDKHLKNAPIIEAIIDARMVFFEPPKADALRAFAETLSGEEMDHGLFREILDGLRQEKNKLFWGTIKDSVLRRFE